MNEFELIDSFFTRPTSDPDVLLGVGDDGAIVRPAAGRDLVIVTDTVVEGVHYPHNMDAADVAYRAVAVNLSDIAAMAARPRWMTLAITLAVNDPDWLQGFSHGLFEVADEYSVKLVGGDTTRGRETVITVQLVGDVEPGTALHRSGAKPGDDIYVTGTPGDAAAGLALWQANTVNSADQKTLYKRFARPPARVAFGERLAAHATAAIDVSDGLYADIARLLQASGVGACIDVDRLPLSESLLALHSEKSAIEFALAGGDDYEIAFAAPTGSASAIGKLAQDCALKVTRIGEITADTGLVCQRDNRPFEYHNAGYRHFD